MGGTEAVTDLAGNPMQQGWSIRFKTEPDTTGPTVVNGWPDRLNNASPYIQPRFVFSESMDPDSAEKAAFQFFDDRGGLVDYSVAASADKRTIRLIPKTKLVNGRLYSIGVISGTGSLTDLSGNNLTNTAAIFLTAGTDTQAPAVKASSPGTGEARVSLNAQPVITFTEAMDPRSLNEQTVILEDGNLEEVKRAPADAGAWTLKLTRGHYLLRDVTDNSKVSFCITGEEMEVVDVTF